MSVQRGRPTKPRCSFCGREAGQVQRLISGPSVHICNECVKLCSQILVAEELNQTKPLDMRRVPTPAEVKAYLDDYVIGQHGAKKSIAVAVYNHYKRIRHHKQSQTKTSKEDVELEKSNILLIGPTGTGKTLLAQTLARMLHVPSAIVDATVLTEAGYVGEDVENILVRLLQAADYDVSKAEMGIVYIDELDKIARKGGANPSITRDVSGEGVQQALLKLLEGTKAHVPPHGGRKHPEQPLVEINTGNILFICGGAFEGLEEIVRTRIGKRIVGFAAETRRKNHESTGEILAQVQPEDLLAYGLIPEIIGRLPVVNSLDKLDREALLQILVQPKNAITKQYQKFFEMEGVTLNFTPDALQSVVDKAMRWGTGARALRSVMEEAMLDIMYELPSRSDVKECLINKEVILHKAEPVYLLKEERKRA